MKPIAGAALGAVMLIGAGLSASPAQADYTVTVVQQGSDVVATGSGAIDTAGLRLIGSGGKTLADMVPSEGGIVTGPGSYQATDVYRGFAGPAQFGAGDVTFATRGSGDRVGIFGGDDILYLPAGYAGTPLSDSSTYVNQTFSSLGVTPGTYVWTWGSGATADSFTLRIEGAAVPEPAGLALLALPVGLVALLAVGRRRMMRTG